MISGKNPRLKQKAARIALLADVGRLAKNETLMRLRSFRVLRHFTT